MKTKISTARCAVLRENVLVTELSAISVKKSSTKALPSNAKRSPKRREKEALKDKTKPTEQSVGFLFTREKDFILSNFRKLTGFLPHVKIKGEKQMEEQKTLKQYCREAKKRLKNGFWQEYHEKLKEELSRAEEYGYSESKIKDYYSSKISSEIRRSDENDEDFYRKVKRILDTEGEIPNAIGRLTDKVYYESLSYEEKQRYNLELSERYLKAVERYNRENALSFAR